MLIIKPPTILRKTLLTALASVLLVVFSFMGAPLLRVLQPALGKAWFWGVAVAVTLTLSLVGLAPVAFLIFGLWVTVGLYGELEAKGRSGFWSALIASAAGTAVSVLGPMAIFRSLDENWMEAFRENLQKVLGQNLPTAETTSWLSGMKVDADFLLSQMPSMVGVLIISSLAFAIVLDRRVALMAGLRYERIASGLRPLEFRIPDGFVFVAMFSFLLSFLKLGTPMVSTISMNIFNVMVGAYFFQGLAVLETAFLVFRAGFFVRAMIYVFVVGQLFFLLSIVGLVDYWVDFRQRLRGMSKSGTDSQTGEQL